MPALNATVSGTGTQREAAISGGIEPLAWKMGRFLALISETGRPEDLQQIEVLGSVSGAFGVFRGDPQGRAVKGRSVFSLVHLPTARLLITLNHHRQCMAMAAEFAPLRVRWDETDPGKVVEGAPDQARVQEIHARYKAMRS